MLCMRIVRSAAVICEGASQLLLNAMHVGKSRRTLNLASARPFPLTESSDDSSRILKSDTSSIGIRQV